MIPKFHPGASESAVRPSESLLAQVALAPTATFSSAGTQAQLPSAKIPA
jgi:hypothetical protein